MSFAQYLPKPTESKLSDKLSQNDQSRRKFASLLANPPERKADAGMEAASVKPNGPAMNAPRRFLSQVMGKVAGIFVQVCAVCIDAPWRWAFGKISSSRRILFNATMANHLAILLPIYAKFHTDPRLEIYFTNSTHLGAEGLGFPLSENMKPTSVLRSSRVKWKRWDACIEADSTTFHQLSRPARRVQTFHGGADKFLVDNSNFTLHSALQRYDLLLCLTQKHVDKLRRAKLEKRKGAARCIGYPKLDALAGGCIDRDQVLESYGADATRPTVLYAPSWNPQLSLKQIGRSLIELLSGRPWTLLVKLHPISYRLKPHVSGHPAWGHGSDWRKLLDAMMNQRKLIHVTDQDSCRYLTAADVLITDHGSTLFEYMVINRPILFYDTAEGNSIMSDPDELAKIRQAAFSFRTPQEALSILAAGQIEDRPGMSRARKLLVEEHFFDVGGAAERAAAAIYELLNLVPPWKHDKQTQGPGETV